MHVIWKLAEKMTLPPWGGVVEIESLDDDRNVGGESYQWFALNQPPRLRLRSNTACLRLLPPKGGAKGNVYDCG